WTKWALDDTFKPQFWYTLRPKAVAGLKADNVPDDVLAKATKAVPPGKNITTRDEFVSTMQKALTADEWAKYGDVILKHADAPNNGGGPDTLAQLLLARSPVPADPAAAKRFAEVRALLLEGQEPGGCWTPA